MFGTVNGARLMQTMRQIDDHGIQMFVFQHLMIVCVDGCTKGRCCCFGTRPDDIRYRGKACARVRGDCLKMTSGDDADANHTERIHMFFSL